VGTTDYEGTKMYEFRYIIDLSGTNSQDKSVSIACEAIGTDDPHLLDNLAATFAMTAEASTGIANGSQSAEGLQVTGTWEH